MTTYKNSLVYKISCKDESITDCYIGSTTNLTRRIWKHWSDCENTNSVTYSRKVYKKIRENGGLNNWNITKISKDDEVCSNRKELIQLERKYYELEKNPSLNTTYPGRNKTECNARWRENNPDYMTNYRIDNVDRIKEMNKQYYQKNKSCISAYNSELIECNFCGTLTRRNNMWRHKKSKKCKQQQNTEQEDKVECS